MSFPNLVPTNEGKAAMLKVIEGDSLTFTRIGLGNGEKPRSIDDLTEMQNWICDGTITDYVPNGIYATLYWKLNTATIDTEFYWTEYALFAKDGDGNEFLFSYAYDDDKPQPLSATNSDSLALLEVELNITVGSAENVTAIIGEYSGYASKDEFDDHLDVLSNPNPHQISAETIGLENVDNVSVDNATPTIDDSMVPSELTNIANGDNAKKLWAKVKKAIASLIAHLGNSSNPHRVTASQVGAASSSHNHNASDINAGTLTIARGGTGATSAANALKALITDALQHIYLGKARYIYGKNANGDNVACCGVWQSDGPFLGNDSMTGHLHGKAICFRTTPDNGTTKKYWHINSSGTFYPGSSKVQNIGSSSYRIATIYATNALNTSDRKEKTNITDCDIGLALLKRLSFKEFNFIGCDKKSVGLIAQEVFEIFQELGIHNSSVYSASVKGNDADKHPELENLTDEQILQYPDYKLTWSLDYAQIANYYGLAFQQYMKMTDERLSAIESLL